MCCNILHSQGPQPLLGTTVLKIAILIIKHFGCIKSNKKCIIAGYHVVAYIYIHKIMLKFVPFW